jgi:hypothetical protein
LKFSFVICSRTPIPGSYHGPQYPTFTQAQSANCHIYQNTRKSDFCMLLNTANQILAPNTSCDGLTVLSEYEGSSCFEAAIAVYWDWWGNAAHSRHGMVLLLIVSVQVLVHGRGFFWHLTVAAPGINNIKCCNYFLIQRCVTDRLLFSLSNWNQAAV